jgi:uncharacterized protein
MVFDGRYLDLVTVFKSSGARFPIDRKLDLSPIDPTFGIAEISGEFVNTNGYVTAKFTFSGMYRSVCDRCLDPVALPLTAEIDTTLDMKEAKDDSITIENGKADLLKTTYDALLLAIPSKVLCKESCKGLCYICGTNLNTKQCDCNT